MSSDSINGIICFVYGGLGNQLFQALAGYLVNKKTTLKNYILKNTTCKHKTNKYDYYDIFLKDFGVQLEINNENFLDFMGKRYNTLSPSTPYSIWNIELADKGTVLCGFYQYYPYIAPYEDDIRDKILSSLEPYRKTLMEKYNFTNRIFLHVRRGDYIGNYYHNHNTIDNYYSKAFNLFADSIKAPIFVISDDIEWVRSEKFFQNDMFEFFNDDEIMTLALMSLCTSGAICANSTFSWWGAFLGSYGKRSKVVVPRGWARHDASNLIPNEWIVI